MSAPSQPTPESNHADHQFTQPVPTTRAPSGPPASSLPPVRITLVGAGPTSLAFAIHLASKVDELLKSGQEVRRVQLDIYDPRLKKRNSGVVDWLGPNDTPKNIRRQQVSTLFTDAPFCFPSSLLFVTRSIWSVYLLLFGKGDDVHPASRMLLPGGD
jgi:hypothetical protein